MTSADWDISQEHCLLFWTVVQISSSEKLFYFNLCLKLQTTGDVLTNCHCLRNKTWTKSWIMMLLQIENRHRILHLNWTLKPLKYQLGQVANITYMIYLFIFFYLNIFNTFIKYFIFHFVYIQSFVSSVYIWNCYSSSTIAGCKAVWCHWCSNNVCFIIMSSSFLTSAESCESAASSELLLSLKTVSITQTNINRVMSLLVMNINIKNCTWEKMTNCEKSISFSRVWLFMTLLM